MTTIDVEDQLLAQTYRKSDARTFGGVVDRALYLYLVTENPDEVLHGEGYYTDSESQAAVESGAGDGVEKSVGGESESESESESETSPNVRAYES